MTIGDMAHWKNRFLSVDQRFTERLVVHWPDCRDSLTSVSEEDDITNNLVYRLCKDPEVRRIGWPEAQYVPFELTGSMGAVTGKGYIDIGFILDQNRDMYIAYECKRLNVTYKGRRSSLAKPYVIEGLYRYIDQQYSRSLPMACMLGYVMDGDVEFALDKVHTAIKAHAGGEKLKSGPNELHKMGTSGRFQTIQKRVDGSAFEVNHTFLSF